VQYALHPILSSQGAHTLKKNLNNASQHRPDMPTKSAATAPFGLAHKAAPALLCCCAVEAQDLRSPSRAGSQS